MQLGGKSVASQLEQSNASASRSSSFADAISEIWDQVKHLIGHLWENFSRLFESNDKSTGELLEEMGYDLLIHIISLTDTVVSKLIDLLGKLILKLADSINQEIHIPVLSPLYKSFSGGTPLTMLDAFCLVFAIPATIGYKVVTGESPTKIVGIDDLTKPYKYLEDLRRRVRPPKASQALAQPQSTAFTTDMGNDLKPSADEDAGLNLQVMFHAQVYNLKESGAETAQAYPIHGFTLDNSQFEKDSTVIDLLTAYGVPAASMLWFDIMTIRGRSKPDTGPPTDDIGLVVDLVIWFFQVKCVGGYGIPGFNRRFGTWMLKLIGVVGNECGKTVKSGCKFWCCSLQLLTSVGNYATLFANDIEVDGYSLVEDIVVIVGDMMANLADGAFGKGPVAVPATIIKNPGHIMRMAKRDTERKGYI